MIRSRKLKEEANLAVNYVIARFQNVNDFITVGSFVQNTFFSLVFISFSILVFFSSCYIVYNY